MTRRGFLKDLRGRARHLAFSSLAYNWSLGGTVPQGFVLRPADIWPGDEERGRWLCGGAFAIDGQTLDMQGGGWEPEGVSEAWLAHMHGFSWLRDLRTLGGDAARLQARSMVQSWIQRYRTCVPAVWRPDLTGQRLACWIALYDFFGASADDEFQDEFFTALIRQARHLCRAGTGGLYGIPALQVARGLVFCGIALSGRESWLEQGLDLLQAETEKQILADGGHVSRNPQLLQDALQIFIDIRSAVQAGGYPVPVPLEHSIDRMAQALRFLRYADRHYALFNGAQEGSAALAEAILSRSNARGKLLRGLPQSGFERLTVGRSVVMMDCGAPPPFPYDRTAHAAPLAFEFVYGKERVFVSCGSHPLDPAWQDALRATAAHNTLALSHRNACEIRADHHFGRRPRKVTVHREENRDAALIEASHDGYVALSGITHRRRLYLGDNGHDLRGEEILTCSVGVTRPAEVCLRFHLHPRVQVSLIQDGNEALLRLPGGAGWRFAARGGTLALENSLYLGEGARPRKTKQIVIAGLMNADHASLKWALQREGR